MQLTAVCFGSLCSNNSKIWCNYTLSSWLLTVVLTFFVPSLPWLAVDRSMTASLSDARDALVNAVIDSLSAYRASVLSNQQPGLMVPFSLRLFPLFVLALLKQVIERETDMVKYQKAKCLFCERLNIGDKSLCNFRFLKMGTFSLIWLSKRLLTKESSKWVVYSKCLVREMLTR